MPGEMQEVLEEEKNFRDGEAVGEVHIYRL